MTKENKEKLKQINAALKIFPSVVKEKERAFREKEKVLKAFAPISRKLKKMMSSRKMALSPEFDESAKIHPWRLCSQGRHWVKAHPMTVEPSESHPDGKTIRHGHCADNPNRGKGTRKAVRDYLASHEMSEIAKIHFGSLSGPPARAPKITDWNFKNADQYDDIIRGWTKYWNEVFEPSEALDPSLVKALIASESGFNPRPEDQNAKKAGRARGLIQLTDQAIKVLSDVNGELKDHYVEISKDDAYDPNLSIAAGIRWLFQKKEWASKRLGREASWDETIAAYKGYLPSMMSGKNPNPVGMKIIRQRYLDLKNYEAYK